MRIRHFTLSLLLAGAALPSGGVAVAAGCTEHRAVCEAACTPERITRFHAGSSRRCEASCEPRWQQCLRTGIWADLERRSTGWWEAADGF